MSYNCECCNFSSILKANYLRHLKTNKHLKRIKSHPKVTKKSPFLYPKVTISENDGLSHLTCKYCNKTFKYKQGLYRHIKYSCKKNKDEDMKELARLMNEIKEQNKSKDKQIEQMQKQIDKLTNKLQIQNFNLQNNTLNQIQNNYHIELLNYNETDYSHLSDKDYINFIKHNNFCVKQLIEQVHFNNEKPENKNIYISNIKSNYVMLYKDNKWQIVNRKEQIDDLYEYNEIILEEWYENYKNKDDEMIKSFERYLKCKEQDDMINHIKEEILLMLYNNRLIENDSK